MNQIKEKGNILLVANWESNVGYAWWLMESFWIIIAKHLEKSAGTKSILIYPKVGGIPETISKTNIAVEEINFRDTSLKGLKRLRKLIKQNNIKQIYLTDSHSYHWLYLLLRLWGIKRIIVHDHTPGERTIPKGLKKISKSLIQRIPWLTADLFIAVTEYVKERLISVTRIPRHKVTCAPNGIIPLDLRNTDKRYAQKEFGIPDKKTIIVTTGRATYYKGIDFIIECANNLINQQQNHEYHFLFCGDGPDINDFKDLVKKYNLTDHFTFAGKRNDIRKILPSCHIGLHAAIGEVGYSLSILEYMSAGLLTIVPNNPSVSSATENNINGLTYTTKDIESCTQQIKRYKNSSPMRENAINDVLTKYSLSHTLSQLIQLFKAPN